MRAHITESGLLHITTENPTELFALRQALGINGNAVSEIETKMHDEQNNLWEEGVRKFTIGKTMLPKHEYNYGCECQYCRGTRSNSNGSKPI